jgi:O-acetyl-ADP-ribose deacetylase (regulator of RNase III)
MQGIAMKHKTQWTNPSVLAFAAGEEPIASMEAKARELALKAMDEGWEGPPYDPVALARWANLSIEARGDIPDARIVPIADGGLLLQYNPTRPRGRMRFSIAHEIAHTLFDDCAEEVRNRGALEDQPKSDSWQLEVLCNIGAAELLMPLGSFSELAGEELSIRSANELRKRFDISMEACLLRLVKLAKISCSAFGASKHADGHYHVDYLIPAPGSAAQVSIGFAIADDSAVAQANAIGFTSVGDETWEGNFVSVECIGLAPYPGTVSPRVVGLLINRDPGEYLPSQLTEVYGDALSPRGIGAKLIAHVVPDVKAVWGGNGFAAQVKRRFPAAWITFREKTAADFKQLPLGSTIIGDLSDSVFIANMIAQRGIGPSSSPRLRYAALASCLSQVRVKALELGASVHMPRIGTGHGGANWDLIKEIVSTELVEKGVSTTVYTPPR